MAGLEPFDHTHPSSPFTPAFLPAFSFPGFADHFSMGESLNQSSRMPQVMVF
jgi:hypothetical protein